MKLFLLSFSRILEYLHEIIDSVKFLHNKPPKKMFLKKCAPSARVLICNQKSIGRIRTRFIDLITKEYFRMLFISLAAFPSLIHGQSQESMKFETNVTENEYWWGGLSRDGHLMPYSSGTDLGRNQYGNNDGNQAQPLLISNQGRYIWSEAPLSYSFANGNLKVESHGDSIIYGDAGKNLVDAFKYVSVNFFPPNEKIPDSLLFKEPQYNTWIELIYDQNEKDILKYAQAILDNGYPPGVLMIDDNWQEDYGDWEFSARRFENPKEMMDKLHKLGFKVMLWICPFVSADSDEFRYLAKEGMLLQEKKEDKQVSWENTQANVSIVRWWNGASGLLDLSNPKTQAWFAEQMDHLVDTYGVDGFKLDAGDAHFYTDHMASFKHSSPNDHTTYFAEIGLKYPLNEYRASWKMAGLPLAQRLHDKRHDWNDLQELIPGIIAQGLMGYAYTCPDMIGGGGYTSFIDGAVIDEELVVRSAQVHALMPMMQFSVAPWRVLNEKNASICKEMALLHSRMGDKITAMAQKSSRTGEPIARPLIYNYPRGDYAQINDQFMLGTDILVAPVIENGARKRTVVIPKGTWIGDDGTKVKGPKTIEIDVPLERLPYYELKK